MSRITFALKSLVPAALFSLLVACGPNVQDFAGMYDVTGSQTTTLVGQGGTYTQTSEIRDSMAVLEGADSDLIVRIGSCNIAFNIEDPDTALLVRGRTCTEISSDGTANFTYTTGSFVRTSKSISTINISADLQVIVDHQTITGTWSTTMNLTKASK